MEPVEELIGDPVQFAQWALDTYVAPAYSSDIDAAAGVELAQWSLSDAEIALFRCELALMAAAGVSTTVAKNFSYEFYKSFANALCGRLVRLLYGHFSEAFVTDARQSMELYVVHLESGLEPGAAGFFVNRVFAENPRKGDLLYNGLWKPGMEALLHALGDSRQVLVQALESSE